MQIYSIWDLQIWDQILFSPPWTKDEKAKANLLQLTPSDLRSDTIITPWKKGKNANLLHMRPPDLRSDTIFTPLDKRQKSKFTPSETSTSEIRYYLTSWTKGKKTNLLQLRTPDLGLDTILTTRTKGTKGKFTPSETFRSEIRYYFQPPGQKANRQIYSIRDLQICD